MRTTERLSMQYSTVRISIIYLRKLDNSLHFRELVIFEVFTICLCYTLVVRYEQYNIVPHNIPTVSTLFYSVHNSVYPKWVYRVKKCAAQKIIGKYLCFQGGDFLTPLAHY